MGTHKRPKPNSLEGRRLKRVTQRRAYFEQAGVTIDLVQRFDALLEKAGVRVAPEDWEVAIDWALQTYPINTSRPVALAAIATSYAATLNSANHAASASSRNLATALSGDPIHAWRMVFGISDEHGTLLGEAPLDVIDETCRTVADHPAWGVLGAARSVYLVASRQVTQVVDERVLRDIVGDDDAARDVLGGKVSRFAVSLAKDLEIPWKESGGADLPRIKADIEAQYGALVEEAIGAGAWPWDEVLAKHLEITGPTGADYAAKIRAASQENMARALAGDSKVGNHAGPGAMLRFWNDPSQQKTLGLRWLSQVAKSLWHDKVKPERDRAHAPRVAAVAPRVVVEAGIRAMGAERLIMSSTLPQTLVGQRGDGPEYPISLALVTSGAVQAVLGDITNGSDDHLWLVFDWVVRAVHQQEQGGVPSPHIITVRGGKDGLRQAVGVASKGQADSVFNALHTLHLLSVVGASKGEPRLLSYSIEQPRGRPARGRPEKLIVIDVGWAMMPHGAAKLGLADRWKVAILPPAYRPEVGRRTTGSRQANAYQSLSLIALEHRREIAREGAFRLTADEWNHHADAAGLYRRSHASLGRDVFDAYLAPPPAQLALGCRPRTGPILVPVEKGSDWYRFGPDFQPEWEHYRQAGDFSEGQAARGEANTAKVVAAAAKARKAKAAKRKREG